MRSSRAKHATVKSMGGLIWVLALATNLEGQAAGQPPPRALTQLSDEFEDLAERVSPAVVQIFARGLGPAASGGPAAAGVVAPQQASGSGVIVDPSGFIVTNAHVVLGATDVSVLLAEPVSEGPGRSILKPMGAMLDAALVGLDRETDLAVLKIEREGLPFLPFGDSETLRSGQIVFAFGSPLGLENSVAMGVVSSVARQLRPQDPMIYVQTDAAVNPGNSGGPLVDTDGRVVGINTLIFSRSGGSEGLSFAAPSNIVRTVYEQIRSTGRVRRGAIAARAQTITPHLARGLGLNQMWGAILSDVYPGGPAASAGLQPGDIVLRLDGKLIENGRQLDVNLYGRQPGTTVELEVLRGPRPLVVQVVVVERPEFTNPFADQITPDRNLLAELGIFAVDLREVAQYFPRARRATGVVVAARVASVLRTESPFEPGDVIYSVNRKLVVGLNDLRGALRTVARGEPAVFHLERRGRLMYEVLEADW